ncbi:lysylphosphatidylglycerol synthase transmembrane domain-containing protein [Thermococcus stetteri]|uniref:lysylphosphatidylglycerol synthase transmembrane domain-containing protein n=1 Tax=Thermococcus stetteri TaxID=49900 RepID=UPI001AE939CC|nr:lysylphosphatidylglycerol synthase transmembrane domain-containing protein [Thermococcus stetteri]MBP1912351.1 uncharacterized membrane protein YbhN (UPF0104 family) [Thermococcus stetteri]
MIKGIMNSGTQYLSIIENIPVTYLLLAVLTYYLSVLIYALRWKLVLRGMGRDAPLEDLVKAILASIFVNNVTPTSRGGGEILRIAWVSKKNSIPPEISTASVIYERILESIPVFALFMLYLTRLHHIPKTVVLVVVIVTGVIWWKWDLLVEFSFKILSKKSDNEEIKKISSLRDKHHITLGVITLSSVVWVLDVIHFKLVTAAFGLNLGWGILIGVSIINFFLGLIALTPGGVGIVEGGLVGLLAHLGVPMALAVPVTLLERFISYVLSSITGFVILVTSGGWLMWRALKSQ